VAVVGFSAEASSTCELHSLDDSQSARALVQRRYHGQGRSFSGLTLIQKLPTDICVDSTALVFSLTSALRQLPVYR
jgi:hypothetical protein